MNSLQTQYGIYVQKFLKSTGAREFGNNAKVVYPITANMDQLAAGIALVEDAPMFMEENASYKLFSIRLDGSARRTDPTLTRSP